ncbi:MAG: DUF1800 family protein [Acidobacteriota bacterium]
MRESFRRFQRLTAFLTLYALTVPMFAIAADNNSSRKLLTDDQKIIHVLNRLGFGVRPGDVEKVRAIGVQKYIERQLDDRSIDDSVAEGKVKDIDVFKLSTAEVFAKYPNPGALLRQLEGARPASADRQRGDTAKSDTEKMAEEQQPTANEQRERRQKLQALYREYDLRPANQILPQIAANRVLRAVYSERQLHEVMVDFWQNHFNVFSGKAAVRWYIPSYERDVLRRNALGNFKDLVVGTAQHPAMLFYLDNFQSVAPNAQAKGGNNRLQQTMRSGNLNRRMRERIKQRQAFNLVIE